MSTQRTIKFRAWHSGEACMIDWDFIIDDGILPYFSSDRYTLMQYTGLKDKDGREIYEGDVLDEGGNIFRVGWNQGDAGWNFDVRTSRTAVVIGNIYEHKELIEA